MRQSGNRMSLGPDLHPGQGRAWGAQGWAALGVPCGCAEREVLAEPRGRAAADGRLRSERSEQRAGGTCPVTAPTAGDGWRPPGSEWLGERMCQS